MTTITAVADLIEVGADEVTAFELVAARRGVPFVEVEAQYHDWHNPMEPDDFANLLEAGGVDLDYLESVWTTD